MKPKLWLGLASVGALLTTSVFAGQRLADDNAGLINDALGLNQKKIDVIEETDDVEGSAYTEEDGSLSDAKWREMINDAYKFCEEAVEQGSVLFKNDNDALPLKKEERNVTLLGQGSKNLFMRSGAGGAAPNNNLVKKLDAAFEENGFNVNHEVFDKYDTLSSSNMTSPSTTVEHSFSGFYTDAMKQSFGQYGDAAIITFVRIGTENTDPSAGKLDLNDNEKQLLQMVREEKDKGTFKKVIVLINSPLAMSTDWVDNDDYGIDACVYMGVPGYYGAGGIVHVLMGEDADGNVINPSGHAVNSFAASASSSAAYQNFGNSSVVVYKEGVYVGYKYYETRYEDLILNPESKANSSKGIYKSTGEWNYADEMGYPFGYGMSYTTFKENLKSVTYDAEKDVINAEVEVENTGDMDGKASVQLYVQAPYTQFDKDNGLGKSAIALMAYDKVDVKAGEKQTVNVPFDRYFLTTYDYKINKTYILEGGDYYFAVGNGAHEALNNIIAFKAPEAAGSLYDHNGDSYVANTDAVKMMAIEDDPVTYKMSHYDKSVEVENQFDDADYNYFATGSSQITYLDRQNWESTWPTATTSNPAPSDARDMSNYYKSAPADGPKYSEGDGEVYNVELDEKITFAEMAKVPLEGEVEDEESRFYGEDGAEIWEQFISQMDLDDLCISVSDNRGILDVLKVMKPGNSVAEGPEGLLSKYQYGDKRWATGFPTGPTYTGTWDHAMQKKFGGFYGEDAIYCGVACVNAPGANINRTPYGSRASEYMSEDAMLNYNTAANIVGAARKKGLIMNIKHCFLNNQESGRQGVATFCNEQALREIYLKPFEGALTKGKGLGIMTSYNRIGVRYAACHEPLMMNVMRGEWGYKGQIIDDALTGSNTSNYSNGPAMLHSGTDLFCLDGNRGGQLKQWVTQYDDGTLLQDLQRANKYIMYSMSRSWMGGITPVTEEEMEAAINPTWKKTVSGITIGTTAAAGTLFAVYAVFEVLGVMAKKKIEGQEDSEYVG